MIHILVTELYTGDEFGEQIIYSWRNCGGKDFFVEQVSENEAPGDGCYFLLCTHG